MTAQEYIAYLKRYMRDIERDFVIDAWNAAKKDCALDCNFRFAIGRIRAVLRDVDEEFDAYQAVAEIDGICNEVWKRRDGISLGK